MLASMDTNTKVLNKNIRYFRRLRGLSQEELASQCNVSKHVISYYETKAVNIPISSLNLIAKALGISVSDLLNDKLTVKNTDIDEIDPRIIKKLYKIKMLPLKEQNSIWHYANTLLEKYGLEKNNKIKKSKHLQETK